MKNIEELLAITNKRFDRINIDIGKCDNVYSYSIISLKCDYCGESIFILQDSLRDEPYYGMQMSRKTNYSYSPLINFIRKNMPDLNVANVHARIHSKPTNETLRFSRNNVKFLCNSCFRKTYDRIIVKDGENLHSISCFDGKSFLSTDMSIIESIKDIDENGTIDCKNLKILGKGGLIDYS